MGLGAAARAVKETAKRLIPRGVVIRTLDRRASNSVLLTFDDGPNPDITPAVLDRLDAHSAKAVFFVVGRRIKHAPGLLDEILKRGHRLGNHSHLHLRSYVRPGPPQVGLRAYYQDLVRCQATIERQVALQPTLFRPPGGRLVPKTLLASRFLGLTCVTWSQDIRDWSFKTSEEAVQGGSKLLAQVVAGDILLLHDDRPPILDLLDVLLPGLVGRGFDLASGIHHL